MPNSKDFSVETQGSKVTGTLTDKLPVNPDTPPMGLTAIGPRVTFHFITVPWSKENSYQYYDVVNVNDNSYIAIKNVPSGVEITDTEYWFHWADPNAQYQELYDIVLTYNQRIQALETLVNGLTSGSTYNELAENGFIYKEVVADANR